MSTSTLNRPSQAILTRPKLQIRPAELEDMPLVASMIRSSADWYAQFVSPADLAEHYVDRSWQLRNYRRREFYLGYNEAGEAVGTLSLQYFGDYAYIGYLYLDTAHMGHGYGRSLLDFARQQALEKQCQGLCLLAHPQADWAVRAYTKYGFSCHSQTAKAILSWNDGALRPYYEAGFDLYTCQV